MKFKEYFERPHINLNGIVGDKMLCDLDRQVHNYLATDKELDPIVTIATTGGGTRYGSAIYEELCALQQPIVSRSRHVPVSRRLDCHGRPARTTICLTRYAVHDS